MESYQVVGLIVSIIGVFLGIGMLFSGIEWIAVAGIGTGPVQFHRRIPSVAESRQEQGSWYLLHSNRSPV